MTEHKFTDEEVIKALEICAKNTVGREGYFTYQGIPLRYLCEDAFSLINRQRAEIEKWQGGYMTQKQEIANLETELKAMRAEIERLKSLHELALAEQRRLAKKQTDKQP